MFHICFTSLYFWSAKLLSFYETANIIAFIFANHLKTARNTKQKVTIYKWEVRNQEAEKRDNNRQNILPFRKHII